MKYNMDCFVEGPARKYQQHQVQNCTWNSNSLTNSLSCLRILFNLIGIFTLMIITGLNIITFLISLHVKKIIFLYVCVFCDLNSLISGTISNDRPHSWKLTHLQGIRQCNHKLGFSSNSYANICNLSYSSI